MRRNTLSVALAAILLCQPFTAAQALAAEGTVVSGSIFEDFSGPAGARPNPEYWSIDVGPSSEKGWERGSLQTYTDSPDNIRLDGYGNLVIEARKSGDGYTSGRLVTRGKLLFPTGTISARIKFPAGQGLWPAFWMLGADIETVGWPDCGEIDIMELINTGSTFNVALHAPGADVERKGPIDDLSRDYHNYWMTRTDDSITVGVDRATLATFTADEFPSPWIFNRPMFALLNLAVGGDWPGPPDQSTPFPASMSIDWFSYTPLGQSQE
jgi:beta-glucanase (GH16 family)